jgi:hypothetical protein
MKQNWRNIKEGTLLLITWDDIVSNASWLPDDKAQIYPPTRCKDIGWFINYDNLNIRISNSVNIDGEKSITVIPKGVIRDVQVVKYKIKGDK